ncbi:MAG TPA: IPT/TIG domain-containing protein [Longimicrobiales bacterium]|nr:IPT/TIG domain-containing protein [Longimicrobiales bacterium]
MSRGTRALAGLPCALWLVVTGCNNEPTQVSVPALEVVVASGDGQFAVVGQELSSPLRALVRSATTGAPREEVPVQWEVTSGSATLLGSPSDVTNEDGSTEMSIRLGSTPGEVEVRVSVAGQAEASATFTAFAVEEPELTTIAPSSAVAGDTVTLTGANFSPMASQDVVLFSGIRGRVVSASGTSLEVEVPPCLPARDVEVVVQLGVVRSEPARTLSITEGGAPADLDVGEVLDATDPAAFDCFLLPGGLDTRYLVLTWSAATVGAALHPSALTLLSSDGLVAAPPAAAREAPPAPAPAAGSVPGEAQAAWDARLRELEGELVRRRGSSVPAPARVGARASAPPEVGHERTFHVLGDDGDFVDVEAVARFVGSHAVIYVDQAAPPAGAFTDTELDSIAGLFDEVIHPEVVAAFGAESDMDHNERVIILFTPHVNALTPSGATGFVGGFFFAGDLLEDNPSEVFYALVPDPQGTINGNVRTKNAVLSVIPGILAHEFQHMVHFNQRVLELGASGQEALWLSEALAQMAEEVVALSYAEVGDDEGARLFRDGARLRALRYLEGTDTVSVIVTGGQGSLAERGAGFLQLLYLTDQDDLDILRRLTATTLTGVANVEAQFGRPWEELLPDWWSAIYLDGPGPETGPRVYPDLDLHGYLEDADPVTTSPIGPGDATISKSLRSSSVAYYILTPPVGGPISVRLGGEAGGPAAPQAALGLRIVRLQ